MYVHCSMMNLVILFYLPLNVLMVLQPIASVTTSTPVEASMPDNTSTTTLPEEIPTSSGTLSVIVTTVPTKEDEITPSAESKNSTVATTVTQPLHISSATTDTEREESTTPRPSPGTVTTPVSISMSSTNTHPKGTSIHANDPSTIPVTLSPGTTHGPTNITCEKKAIYVRINDTAYINCTIYINPGYLEWKEWTLEAFFVPTKFNLNNTETDVAKIENFNKPWKVVNSYPSRGELLFTLNRKKNGNTLLTPSDKPEKFTILIESNINKFSLIIQNIGIGDHGTFRFILRDKMHIPMVRRNVTMNIYKAPETLELVAPPTAIGNTYEATCTVSKFFPPGSMKIEWTINGKPKNLLRRDSSLRSFWWMDYENGATFVSTLQLWKARGSKKPPNVQCNGIWNVLDITKNCNLSITPKLFRKPELSIAFEDGYAVCNIRCVPHDVLITWLINDDDSQHERTETAITDQCKHDSTLVNIKSRVLITDSWTNSKYSCRLKDYPSDAPPYEVSKMYDATPISRGRPIIALIVMVFGIALILALVILVVALCLYNSSNSVKYRRL